MLVTTGIKQIQNPDYQHIENQFQYNLEPFLELSPTLRIIFKKNDLAL